MATKSMDLGQVMGTSAYQAAQAGGYTGTQTEFNSALKEVPEHIDNNDIHVTAEQKAAWNGSVRYDAAQSLTDAQKTQALANINAAPGGFGLGGAAKILAPADNLNDVWQAGWYAWDAAPQNAPTAGGSLIPYCSMNVLNKGSNYNIHQIARTFEGYEIHRYYDGSKQTWSEWAWANPPMMAGVEYRTTKYYLGKPVYTQIVQFDNLSTNQSFSPGGEIFRAIGEYQYPDTSGKYVPNMPTRILGETMTMDSPYMDFSDTYNRTLRVQLKSDSKCLGKSARVQMWYT